MDWSGCELVEVVPGKVSGVPLVVGTRIPADVILKNFAAGSPIEEIEENYPSLSRKTIAALLAYAESRHLQAAS
jgi:uncharacterized protein (DUF433 family)